MPSDTTTFLAAFGALFGLILASLWRLELRARRLEKRLAQLDGADAKPKTRDGTGPS